MTFRTFVLTTACTVVLSVAACGSAHASTIDDTVTGTATVTEQYTNRSGNSGGGPSISPSSISVSSSVEVSPATTFSSDYSFTLSPYGSCSGGGCSANTETDTITVTFSGFQIKVGSTSYAVPTFSETGIFTAKYSGSELACAAGDRVSPSSGATDCLVWAGASNTYNGTTTLFEAITGLTGDSLEVQFNNATDWNITPSFQVAVTIGGSGGSPPIHEPGTLAILGTGLFGMAMIRRRHFKVD